MEALTPELEEWMSFVQKRLVLNSVSPQIGYINSKEYF